MFFGLSRPMYFAGGYKFTQTVSALAFEQNGTAKGTK
jgi:hypothetical protein